LIGRWAGPVNRQSLFRQGSCGWFSNRLKVKIPFMRKGWASGLKTKKLALRCTKTPYFIPGRFEAAAALGYKASSRSVGASAKFHGAQRADQG
jgi:hypothetical protein